MKNVKLILLICIILSFFTSVIFALNPFITHIYTADPSAHVFEKRVYVYPSHDKDNADWFDMEDYHVFSSADLKNWIDHGVVLRYQDVPWVAEPEGTGEYDLHPRMWAPDCAFKNGKYYLYFPACKPNGKFKIGVAVNENGSPAGPFTALDNPIPGSSSVDPCVFVDNDGQAYMFYGGQGRGGRDDQGPLWVKLQSDPNNSSFMTEFDGTPQEITSGVDYWFEACWIHKRNGIYYLSYSTGANAGGDSKIHYSTSTSITGPWTYKGEVIGDVSGWTNHHSFVKYKGNWYAFYHTSDMSGGITAKRSICVDRVYYNDSDGTMRKVYQTREGTGTSAYSRIKAQFYSNMSGVETELCGGGDIGERVSYIHNGDNLIYNLVNFGSIGAKGFEACVASNNSGGTIEIYRRQGDIDWILLGSVDVGHTGGWGDQANDWTIVSCDLDYTTYGTHSILLNFKGGSYGLMNLNWFRFKPSQNIPVGHSVALKSKNPDCIDDNQNQGQMYLSVDKNKGADLCANKDRVKGSWEKFSVLASFNFFENNIIQLNSSNNGKNLYDSNNSNIPINAKGGSYREALLQDLLYWIPNDNGTISFRSYQSNNYYCADTSKGDIPTKVYANKSSIASSWEKFYVEVADAPIGCVVAFKSLNSYCIDNNGGMGQNYIHVNNSKYLVARRTVASGNGQKFLVVDAGNGYIALKSLRSNKYVNIVDANKYLVIPDDKDWEVRAGASSIRSSSKFQWRNNGDGTISLYNPLVKKYLSVDIFLSSDPTKVYANKDEVESSSWEKFYCQIVK